MSPIYNFLNPKHLFTLLCFSCNIFFGQSEDGATTRLDKFMQASCKIEYQEVVSDTIAQILKHKVYYITQETINIYGRKDKTSNKFIVIDNGMEVKPFEKITADTDLPQLLSYIRSDFNLNDETAGPFQSMLDVIYPIATWKTDKREYFSQEDKWYFLRDAYFRSKQGFEVSMDSVGKITGICYKMKWDKQAQSK